jgi:hypothetical protein
MRNWFALQFFFIVAASAVGQVSQAVGQRSFDPVTITIIGGQIVLIIGAIVTGILAVITHLRMTSVKEQQQVTVTRLDTVAADTEAIKGHVNSEKTAAEGRLAALQKENDLLREMLTDKKATAALLAQAVATKDALLTPAPGQVIEDPKK